MAVWSRWLESATRRVGFRALKKTLEALYTTKVKNRDRTSRGTTLAYTQHDSTRSAVSKVIIGVTQLEKWYGNGKWDYRRKCTVELWSRI